MKSMLHKSFNSSKCKTTLKLAVSRLKLMRNKKGIQLTQSKREVGQLLSAGQDQTAMIRVEHVVREEKTIAAFELVELYCELIVARLPIIESQKICPMDLKEAVTGVIFAAPRCADIPELKDISKHLTAKYGKDFVNAAIELRPDCGVNRTLVEKLSAKAPDGPTKIKILTTIAEENGIKWESSFSKEEDHGPSFPNISNIEKGSRMQTEPAPNINPEQGFSSNNPVNGSKFQATQYTVPRKGTTSSSFDGAASSRPGWNSSNVGPSSDDLVRPNKSYDKGSDDSRENRPNYNMGYKDATDAANAAARSAEEASRAARAAAEIASRGKKMNYDHSISGTKFGYAQNKDDDRYNNGSVGDETMENSSMSCSPPERNPRLKESVPGEADRQDRMFETASEVGSKSDQHYSALPNAHNTSERGNPPKHTDWEVDSEQSKLSLKKDLHQEDSGSDTENNNVYALPSRDSTQTRTHKGSADLSDSSSHSVRQTEHVSVDNPFFQEPEGTISSTSRYEYSGISENYGAPDFNTPIFDDDPHADPFIVWHEKQALKEDGALRESYDPTVTVPSTDLYSQKENVFSHPEQKTYRFEPNDVWSRGTEQGSMQIEKEHMHTDSSVNAIFDDLGSDDDDDNVRMYDLVGKVDEQRSALRNLSSPEKSSVPSSPEPQRPTRSWERQSSTVTKNLYQPELSESFKNSPLFSQLDKPLSISFDDSDDDDSDAIKSKGGRKHGSISSYHDSPKAETKAISGSLREGTESSLVQRGNSGLHPESLVSRQLVEEYDQPSSVNLLPDNFTASDIYIHKQSSLTTSRHDSKSLDCQNFSNGEDDVEEEQGHRESLKFAMSNESPGLIDKHSDIESRTELNVESWPRAQSGGLLPPPYTKDPSNLSSTSASIRRSFDATPIGSQWQSTAPSSEREELPARSVSTHQKSVGSDSDYSGDRYAESGVRKHQGPLGNVEGLGSHDEDTTAFPSKGGRVGTGVSRRTRASREPVPSSQPDSRPSYTTQSAPEEPVPERRPSSASSNRAMERAQLLRWAEDQAGYNPTHQSQNSDGEEILAPSIGKQERHSRVGGLGGRQAGNEMPTSDFRRSMEAEVEHNPSHKPNLTAGEENLKPLVEKKQLRGKDKSTRSRRPKPELPRRVEALADHEPTLTPKRSLQEDNFRPPFEEEKRLADSTRESVTSGSNLTEDVPASRDSSMKRAGHVHPRLPDFDTLADRIRALSRDQQK